MAARKKWQRKKRLYRKNNRYNRCIWCLFICTEIYKFFYTFRINLIINLRKWKQYFSVNAKKYSFRQALSSVFKSIIISISLYLFRLFLFFLALCSPFQVAPARSELQAEFFLHAETMSILILRRWFSFYVPRIAKYGLTGLKTKIQPLRHIQMVLISRIFHAKPLTCCSHPLDIELLFAPFIGQFTALWRHSLPAHFFATALSVAAKIHPSPMTLPSPR